MSKVKELYKVNKERLKWRGHHEVIENGPDRLIDRKKVGK